MVETSGIDTSEWWLFDVKTGELEAIGGRPAYLTDHYGTGCQAARRGFAFPLQCNNDNGWFAGSGPIPQQADEACAAADAAGE